MHKTVLKSIPRLSFPLPFPSCKNAALSLSLILMNLLHSLMETMAYEPTRKVHWPAWNALFLSQPLDLFGTDQSRAISHSLINDPPLILSGVLGCKGKLRGPPRFLPFPLFHSEMSFLGLLLCFTQSKNKSNTQYPLFGSYPSKKQHKQDKTTTTTNQVNSDASWSWMMTEQLNKQSTC